MNKAEDISGFITMLVGASILMGIYPLAEIIKTPQAIAAEVLIGLMLGLSIIKFGIETINW